MGGVAAGLLVAPEEVEAGSQEEGGHNQPGASTQGEEVP